MHKTAADIQGNVEFMNQINQAYTYVQIPLQMSGQNASAELFVYTNKKALAEGDRELTAFLHLGSGSSWCNGCVCKNEKQTGKHEFLSG